MPDKVYDLEDRFVEFAARVIDVVESLPNTRAGNYLAGQLIRCGLAPALLYGEAQSAESRDDFIHKRDPAGRSIIDLRKQPALIEAQIAVDDSSVLESEKPHEDFMKPQKEPGED